MKALKYIAIMSLTLSLAGVVQAKSNLHSTQVPFYNVNLSEGEMMIADYHFGAHQTIVCKQTSESHTASIEWKYKGVTYKKMLPVTLKDDSRYAGEWADSGTYLLLTNEYGPSDLLVTCEYKDMD